MTEIQEGQVLEGSRDRYRVLEHLRDGRAGGVWRGERVSDGRPVALKTFRLSRPAELVELRQELHTLESLAASGLFPRLYDYSVDPQGRNGGFAALELFERSLQDLLEERPLTATESRRLLVQLADALAEMHRRALLHLDVKPGNVLVGDDRFVLADFGLSRPIGARAAVLPPSYGTPGYRAPEQAQGRPELFGVRTDLYGLGATVWAAISGRPLSFRDEPEDWTQLTGLPHVRSEAADVEADVAALVMRLLRTRDDLRPGSAREVAHRLENGSGLAITPCENLIDPGELRALIDELNHPLLRHVLLQMPRLRAARFSAGETLCAEGEYAWEAWILLSGVVRVVREDEPLAEIRAIGEIFGEIGALTGEPRTASLRAEEDVVALVLDGAELFDFLRLNPELAIQLVADLAERVTREVNRTHGDTP